MTSSVNTFNSLRAVRPNDDGTGFIIQQVDSDSQLDSDAGLQVNAAGELTFNGEVISGSGGEGTTGTTGTGGIINEVDFGTSITVANGDSFFLKAIGGGGQGNANSNGRDGANMRFGGNGGAGGRGVIELSFTTAGTLTFFIGENAQSSTITFTPTGGTGVNVITASPGSNGGAPRSSPPTSGGQGADGSITINTTNANWTTTRSNTGSSISGESQITSNRTTASAGYAGAGGIGGNGGSTTGSAGYVGIHRI